MRRACAVGGVTAQMVFLLGRTEMLQSSPVRAVSEVSTLFPMMPESGISILWCHSRFQSKHIVVQSAANSRVSISLLPLGGEDVRV